MRLKLDENLPDEIAVVLGSLGHDADTVRAEGLSGAKDIEVLTRAGADDRTLVTLDVRLASGQSVGRRGIILLRLGRQGPQAVQDALLRALHAIKPESLAGRVVVITETRVRYRP